METARVERNSGEYIACKSLSIKVAGVIISLEIFSLQFLYLWSSLPVP